MSYSYYLGLDLGQSSDYTALSILEEPVWLPAGLRMAGISGLLPGWVSPDELGPDELDALRSIERREGRPHGVPLPVRHLERFELGTPYPAVVERVRDVLGMIADKGAVLLVDKTGVGAGVVDMFRWAGCRPVPITIHGGSSVQKDKDGRGFRVPKRDLVGAVQVLLQATPGRLKIAKALKESETLTNELLNFKVKLDPRTAHDSYEHWREGDHDDLVLATAMACWFRQWWNANLDVGNALAEPRLGVR